MKEMEAVLDAVDVPKESVKGKVQVHPKPKHKKRAAGRARIKAK